MTSCHECGSDVAETDVFCPFCGISLKPVALEDDNSDLSFESTIVMQSPEVPKPVSAGVSPDLGTPSAPAQESGDTPEPPSPLEANNELQDLKTSDPREETTLEDIRIDDGASIGASDVSKQPTPITSFENQGSAPDLRPASTFDISQVPVPNALEALENTAGKLFKDIESPRPFVGKVGEPGLEGDQAGEENARQERADGDESLSNEIGDVKEPIEPAAQSEPLETVDADLQKESLFPSVTEEELTKSDELPREQSISMPSDIPVPADQFSTPSKFDSVRIMETPGADINTLVAGRSDNAREPGLSNSAAAAATGESNKDPRPETSSSIGLVDTDGRRSSKLKPLEEGIVLNGRYEIVRKIGGGGMGAVYLSSDNNLGGVLRAVKEMVQSHIEEEQQEKAVQDFKRESMILSTLDHPSIPTIYDYFFDDKESRFYLVMKYISGGDLAARLRSAPEGKLDEITVTEWGIQIADVLDYLHNQPTTIVYRDLKPSNIMIDGNSGRVMLIDFGIARSIGQREEKGVTAVGTMGYAPPELFSGNVEPRSDIYSLGSTMFHLLTGADPQSNPLLIFDFQKNPRPRQINPQLSDQVERFLMKAVEYNASSRFISAGEVRHFLEEHLDNLRKGNVTYGIKEIPASVSLANQSVFCGFCGQKIVATDLFCAFCGAKQPIAQHGVHSEIYTPAPMTAKLFVMGTSDLDSPIFQLEKAENLLGRRDPMSNIFPEVDLSKYDPQTKISRRHAKIWREGSSYLVEDLASSNGTIVLPAGNESLRLLPHQPYTLSNGDKIKLGDTTLHFVVG